MQLFGGKGKMLGLLLVLAAFGSFYLGDITAFTTSQKAIAGVALFIIVLLAGISLLKPKKTEEDMKWSLIPACGKRTEEVFM